MWSGPVLTTSENGFSDLSTITVCVYLHVAFNVLKCIAINTC